MEHDTNKALCTLAQLYSVKLQKLEDQLKQLVYLCEIENCNLKYNESAIQLIQLILGLSMRNNNNHYYERKREFNDQEATFSASSTKREIKKNIYIPKYEWTNERTQRLLDSIAHHSLDLMNSKDFTKPIWEIIKLETDPENNNLRWYTCRQKWSQLESDYRNYVKDLKKYLEANISQMNVFVPQFYQQIGLILRGVDNQITNEDNSINVFQQFIEHRIAEELQTRDTNRFENFQSVEVTSNEN